MANFVENSCKNMWVSSRKTLEKLCEKLYFKLFACKTISFPQVFPRLLTAFFTFFSPLFIPKLFHFSTKSITTIINKNLERI